MEYDGLIRLPGIRAHVAAIRALQDALAAFFRFFSLTYQVVNKWIAKPSILINLHV
jgi:hypothetical protein